MRITTLSAALCSAVLAQASSLLLTIPPSAQLPNPAALPASTTAHLSSLKDHHSAPLRTDSTFLFNNLTEGSWLLDVHCASHAVAPLRIDITRAPKESSSKAGDTWLVQAWGTFRGNEWDNKGEVFPVQEVSLGGRTVHSVELRLLGEKSYYVERTGCK